MKALYYTVDKSDVEMYGTRTIRVYKVNYSSLVLVSELTAKQDELGRNFYSDEEEIQMWLDDENDDSDYEFFNLNH